eukprot:TRINITY_DN20457_c0_g2_i1.p1 TRINITY_DN20457_c0_g2~~TRINITY_DN20457_c0_g2_i1.p1  ORF type:complete len:273 (+),score=46.40 TRINITY_DN20457_c0_g2_i1:164-982(+)
MADGDGVRDLAIIRITLLGPSRSGKSCLASAFVSNHARLLYEATEEPGLLYTTVHIAGSEDDNPFNALCEVEDTPGSERTSVQEMEHFYDILWPAQAKQETSLRDVEETDERGVVRSILVPFGTYPAPLGHGPAPWRHASRYSPMAKNRMAYVLVFDANSSKSYLEAVKLHGKLKEYWQKKGYTLKPCVFLVANKIDQDPLSEELMTVRQNALTYSDFNAIPLFEVSAVQYKGVKKLFRAVVQRVRVNQALWKIGFREKAIESAGAAGCRQS